MQTPTCKNVRIRSIQDVHKIFAAVERGWLKMITRRLDTDERMELCSGCIYVWEERGPNTEVTGLGMERFTEGRRWSPSRVRDDFLFYFEQYSGGDGSDNQPPRDWDPLIKQTYSALVQTPRGIRKWHMTAYYTEGSMDDLGSIDDIDGVRDLVVPEGTYTSHKATKNKAEKKKKSGVTRKYAGFP
ncbi:Gti1/Pac2 family-domain-containing protein, partial [Mucidula mucida]